VTETVPAPDAETVAETDAASAASTDEPVALNRAERRARGKAGAQSQQPYGRGKVAGQTGPAAGHRLWANRRGGG
jgi:hypothetical protein